MYFEFHNVWFDNEIQNTLTNGRWSSIIHVFCLAAILQHPIVGNIFKSTRMHRDLYHHIVEPVRRTKIVTCLPNVSAPKKDLMIFWSKVSSAHQQYYEPDHVVPVVRLKDVNDYVPPVKSKKKNVTPLGKQS